MDQFDLESPCMRCPWNRKRVARNDRWVTLGDPLTGVTIHLRLCNEDAHAFDMVWNAWAQLEDPDDFEDQCVRCPYSRRRPARNDRWLTFGDPLTGVTIHLRLCNKDAKRFDIEWNTWVQLGDVVQRRKEIRDDPVPAPVSVVPDKGVNDRLKELAEAARQRNKAAVAATMRPSPADLWRFSDHAVERMQERGFSDRQVLHTVTNPEKVLPDPAHPGCERRLNGYCCVVVNPTQKKIVTVFDKFKLQLLMLDEKDAVLAAQKGA